MDRDLNNVVRLIQRAQLRVLTKKEEEELARLLRNEYLAAAYESIKKGQNIADRLNAYEQYSATEAYKKFYALCRRRNYKRIRRIIVGIAAVFIVVLGTVLLLNGRQEMKDVDIPVNNNQIAPGKHQAILRLTDGSMMPVGQDSIQIQEKNGTQIKYANGKISYRSTDKVVESVYNELIVPLAGECYLILDDGTKIWINSDSKLIYPVKFLGDERKVKLEGEAYFDVAKNGKPFIVNTILGDIRVLGTEFGVKAYREEEQLIATLVEGKISFSGTQTVELNRGEQLVVLKDGRMTRQAVEVEEFVGWKDNLFVFRNQRLEDIMRELTRWYNIKVFYQQPYLKDIEFTGNLKRYDNVNVFMELLKSTNELNYSIQGNTIILY